MSQHPSFPRYWVEWTCEGNDFVANYDTAEERDARVTALREEEIQGDAERLVSEFGEPYAYDIRIGEYR